MYSFFKYLLFCAGCNSMDELKKETQKLPEPTAIYIKVKDFPLGIIEPKDESRFRGTTILVRIESIAGYPFPAKIEKIQNRGDLITISFLDIMGESKILLLEPMNEMKIVAVRDRSPIAAALRESEKLIAIRERQSRLDDRRVEESKVKSISLKRLHDELQRFSVRSRISDDRDKLLFTDGIYYVSYIKDENRFEIYVTKTDDFISDYADDAIGFKRLIKKIRKIDAEFDPEEHLSEYLE